MEGFIRSLNVAQFKMDNQNRKYRLHPEVESDIRAQARAFMVASLSADNGKDPFLRSAEAEAITFDEFYFLGLYEACGSMALENLMDTGDMPVVQISTEQGVYVAPVDDDPVFRRMLEDRSSQLAGLIYGLKPEEVEERFYDIHRRSTEFHNKSLGDKSI